MPSKQTTTKTQPTPDIKVANTNAKERSDRPKPVVTNEIPLIKVMNYSKIFKDFVAVNDISFEVKKGSIHGFIGPNGAGKTTTIKALIGAYRPTKGDIKIKNSKSNEYFSWGTKDAKKEIGYIPERASFPKNMNCIEYLYFVSTLNGLKREEAHAKAWQLLTEIGLKKHAHRKPYEFSSGMKKKVLIAQALMNDPSVLILDEPAANLDPSARRELFDLLLKLKSEGKSIFISSHILSELQEIVDDVTIIFQGVIRYSGGVNIKTDQAEYQFETEDDDKVRELAKKKKLDCKNDSNGKVIITATSQASMNEFISAVLTAGITVNRLINVGGDLTKIFDKMAAKYGTVSGAGNEGEK